LNLEQFRGRRQLLLTAFECGAGLRPFAAWVQESESFSANRSEKLDLYLRPAYDLLRDLLALTNGRPALQNRDLDERLSTLAKGLSFAWLEAAAKALDELVQMARRNIQKTAALDAMIIKLRNEPNSART
jgi:hypothetical protein